MSGFIKPTLSHYDSYGIFALNEIERNQVSLQFAAVQDDFLDASLHATLVLDGEAQGFIPEPSPDRECLPSGRNAGIDFKAGRFGPYTEYILDGREIGPGCGSGQPGETGCAFPR